MKDFFAVAAYLAVVVVLAGAYLWLFYQVMWHPERVVRFWLRINNAVWSLIFRPGGQQMFQRTFPLLAYSWFGTSGSPEKDARFEWRAAMYLRFLFIFASVGWALVILGVI